MKIETLGAKRAGERATMLDIAQELFGLAGAEFSEDSRQHPLWPLVVRLRETPADAPEQIAHLQKRLCALKAEETPQ